MVKKESDIIIVGAGPSGLMLANNLKDSGLDVLLLEEREIEKVEK